MSADYNRTEDDSLKHFCDWTSFCIYHSDMDAPQYVHVDVPSDYQWPWMFYYTHHNNMDASHYVHVYVTSNVTDSWRFYYTIFIDTDAPQYVHVNVLSDYLCLWTFYYTRHNDTMFFSTYMLMYLQTTRAPECFITHIPTICTHWCTFRLNWYVHVDVPWNILVS